MVYDVIGGVFLYHLIQEAELIQLESSKPWVEEAINNWRIAAIITELAAYANDEWSEKQLIVVLSLASKAIETVRNHGDFSQELVSSWHIKDDHKIFHRGLEPIPCEAVARFGEAFSGLLNDVLPEPPSGKWWFFGSKDTVETIEMGVDYDDLDFHQTQ